jgi:uncharacterized membrane protein
MAGNLIVLAFDDIGTALEMLSDLEPLRETGDLVLEDAVIVTRKQSNVADIQQMMVPSDKKYAGRGAAIGFIGGLLFGGPILGAMAGASIGAIANHMRDRGIEDKFIEEISDGLQPDSSALFLLVHEANAEKALEVVGRFHGRVLSTTLDEEQENELRKRLQ